jgi:AraC-like DNA-binding protein
MKIGAYDLSSYFCDGNRRMKDRLQHIKSKAAIGLLPSLLRMWMCVGWMSFGCLLSAQSTQGHIYYADPAPRIDGQGDDWPTDSAIVFVQQNPIAANANTMAVQLSWDEQYLYLYAEVSDQQIVQLTKDPAQIYLNDAIELYIDPLDDSGNRMDINDYQFIVDHTGAVAVLKGDKSLITDTSNAAPKELGIATVTYRHAVSRMPRIDGHEQGYAVEMALPFAGMGAQPRAGMQLKIDFCVDDLDSLVDLLAIGEGAHLPGFFASNWEGYRDFSFPDHWRTFTLSGEPSMTSRLSRDLLPYWIWIVLGIVVVAGLVIAWQAYRIAQLKDVLPRKAVRPALMRALAGTSAPAQAAMPAQPTAEMPVVEQTAAPVSAPLAAEPTHALSPPQDAITQGKPSLRDPVAPLHPQIERCRQYVLQHLDAELKMEDLASACALSLRTLQRVFKDEMDMSPVNFVVLIKMECAADLLRSGRCNVSEAAWQLGFQDSSYFSRVFKKYHGVSPKSFLLA